MTDNIPDNQQDNKPAETPKQLQPFVFKPGQSGNPKGRPKEVMTKKQRRKALSIYALLNPDKANPIQAIQELNKMDHVYDEKPQFNDNKVINIIIQGEGGREKVNQILEGMRHGEMVEKEGADDRAE